MAAPVKNTCPDIDKAIRIIESAIKTAEYGMKNSERSSDQYDWFKEIVNEIEDVPGMLESLREANDSLRTWGKELEDELQTAAYQIDDLETQLAYKPLSSPA